MEIKSKTAGKLKQANTLSWLQNTNIQSTLTLLYYFFINMIFMVDGTQSNITLIWYILIDPQSLPEELVVSSFLSSSSLSLQSVPSAPPSWSLSVSLVSLLSVGVPGLLLLLLFGSLPLRLPTVRLEGVLTRSATTPAGYSLTMPSWRDTYARVSHRVKVRIKQHFKCVKPVMQTLSHRNHDCTCSFVPSQPTQTYQAFRVNNIFHFRSGELHLPEPYTCSNKCHMVCCPPDSPYSSACMCLELHGKL